jgi:NADH dehydrogenase
MTQDRADAKRPRIVIVGAGFGGLEAAQRLAKAPVDVVILDRSNHHLFQPLLYQVATAVLSPADIAFPIRRVFRHRPNVLVFRANVASVDLDRNEIVHDDGARTSFDYLILAAGAGQSYFGRPEWEACAPGMKTLEDAARIRARVLQAFEDAEAEVDPEALTSHLTFVVVGAGPTGVELAGAIKELAVDAIARDFHRVNAGDARVILVEAQDRLLPAMSRTSSHAARAALEKIGVDVRLDTRVIDVSKDGVTLERGGHHEAIRADTVLWAAGVTASPLGASLGVTCDRVGRVVVEPDLSVSGHPHVFVIGDMAAVTCAKTRQAVPGVCPAAVQMGTHVARIIVNEVTARRRVGTERPARPAFAYFDKGSLATIGRAKAVADLWGRHFKGFLAWCLWSFVHVFFLIGFRNRVFVSLSWAITYLLYTKGARIILGDPESRVARRAE